MPLLAVDHSQLYYHPVGHGPACLVMHGGLGVDHTWLQPWLDPVSEVLKLVYYDHRGNGRSTCEDPGSISIETLCSDAEALRAHLGEDRIALIGHSYGALVAMQYALQHPERVSHLVLLGAAPRINFAQFGLVAQRRGANARQLAALSSLGSGSDDEFGAALQELLPLYLHRYRGDEYERFAARTRWSATAFRRGAEVAARFDLTPRLGEISAPTLIVAGDDDLITPVERAEILHRGIPNSELYIIPRSGHVPHFEQPEPFLWVVKSWLAKHFKSPRRLH